MSGFYDLTDKAIDLLNRRAVKRFEDAKDKASQMGFDELNVLEINRTLYDQLRKDNPLPAESDTPRSPQEADRGK